MLGTVRYPPVALALTAAACAAAGVAQSMAAEHALSSLTGFALAALLIVLVQPTEPPEVVSAAADPAYHVPRAVWWLLGLGTALSLSAALGVYWRARARVTHSLWDTGLILYVAAAWRARRRTPGRRVDWATLAIMIGLAAFAAVLFGWHLSTMPPEVHGDDAEVGLDAIRLLERFNLFEAGWFELPRFHALPTAVGVYLFGPTRLGLRFPSAVLGIATVLLLFALARRLWNTEVALIAALLLAGQRFFIHLSRAGYHYIDTPFLSVLVLYLFVRVWQERRLGAAVWCGIVLGFGVQTYYASRLVPVLLALTFAGWLAREWWLRRDLRAALRGRLLPFAVIAVVAIATAAPIGAYFAHRWEALWERTSDTSIFTDAAREHLSHGYGTKDIGAILLIQARTTLSLFNATGDNSMQYGYSAPLFDPISAALFVLGTALVVAGAAWRRNQMLLLWTAVPLVAGAMFTIDAPFYPRISGLVPFAVLIVALAVQHLVSTVRAALPGSLGQRAGLVLAAGLATAIVAINAQTYFADYAPHHRHSPALEIGLWIRAHGAGRTTYMIGGAPRFFIHHGTISFLSYGYAKRDVEDLEQFLQQERFDPATSAFIIMPAGEPLLGRLQQAVGPLTVESHYNIRDEIAFFTALPQADARAAPGPAAGAAHPGPPLPPSWRGWRRAFTVLTGLAGVAALFYGLLGMVRQRRGRAKGKNPTPYVDELSTSRTPDSELIERAALRAAGVPSRWLVAMLLVAIVAGGAGMRMYRLTELPAGFYCDEAALGYNAYSILKTGLDENGEHWPLYVWSFDTSYKNPVFIYSSMLPLALLGPTELAVRLTAALYGSATVLAMFFLGRAVMGTWVGLFAAVLLAVCPWHVHFSRIGFELITFPFFFALGVIALVRFLRGARSLTTAALCLGAALYTYVPAKLFVPLFLGAFAIVYQDELRRRWREVAVAAVLLAALAAPLVAFDIAHRERTSAYFSRTTLLEQDESPWILARMFASNYVAFFSPEFLFTKGGDRIVRHNIDDHGELYPIFAPLLLLGLGVALVRRDRVMGVPLLWLALYPIAPALMNEIPSASRGLIGAPGFCLLAAMGGGALMQMAARITARRRVALGAQLLVLALGAAVLAPQVRHYWHLYSEDYPLYSAKYYYGFQFGKRQVVQYFMAHYDDYDEMVLSARMSNQADVFMRFYDGLARPPRPDAIPRFEHGGKMRVGWADELDQYREPLNRLFAVRPEEVPLFVEADVKERVIAPDGSAAFVIVAARALKPFVHVWRVMGLFEPDQQHEPPPFDPAHPRGPGPDGRRWRLYRHRLAAVGLNDVFTDNAEHACAWAVNIAHSDRTRSVRIWAGFDDTGEVWVNGARVPLTRVETEDAALVDSENGTAVLRAGANVVAVRSCDDTADWRFYFRLADPHGAALDGVTWEYRDPEDG